MARLTLSLWAIVPPVAIPGDISPAADGRGLAIFEQNSGAGLVLADDAHSFSLIGLELLSHRGDARFEGCAPSSELALFGFQLLFANHRLCLFARLLRRSHRASQNAFRSGINIQHFDAAVGQKEFAELIRMGHATGFEHVENAIALSGQLHVA